MSHNGRYTGGSARESKEIEDHVNWEVGISRRKLNIRAAIGIVIFGWLMKMNYDDLGHRGTGWLFMIAMGVALAIAWRAESDFARLIPTFIYVAAWVHTNAILSGKQSIAREQHLREKRFHSMARRIGA